MDWVVAVGLLVGAAVLLAVGAELFAEHAGAAGRRLGVSGLGVGLLLAGAEPEELVTAVLAALRDQPGIAAGDAIGANVTLLTLITGSLALASPFDLGRRGARYAAAALAASAAAWGALLDGAVGRIEGAGLAVLYGLLVAAIWRSERGLPAIGELSEALEDSDDEAESRTRGLLLAMGGIAAMGVGGWLAVSGAERLVTLAGVGGSVVGLTVVALATTSEFVALIPASLRRGIPELAAAGIVGSVIYNATATLGIAALARPLAAGGVTFSAAGAVGLVAVIGAIAWARGRIGRPTAAVLLAGYAAYTWLLWR